MHEEMLSKFGDGYCGAILFFLSFWAASAGIRVGLSASTNAISPDAMVSGALMLGGYSTSYKLLYNELCNNAYSCESKSLHHRTDS
ncbi:MULTISPECIES: hypothetical protein [unclassified Wolbachia]|uniref:hypothetical protein n=1 Tax=unclassified Wolbachia TaxID=2640676 RepID=UPI00222E65E1|nr:MULTISPECIES: hypothetical protein [unclassified Wolbachia]